MTSKKELVRIGIFYDGNYFFHVSNYYNYEHERRSRLSINGLHNFIRELVAENEEVDPHLCQIVDAHYFRGKLNAPEAKNRNRLMAERLFEDMLMHEGIVTHFLPLVNRDGRLEEKGINVWLALEAYEQTLHKSFDIVVLVACDSEYVPLLRKLSTLGCRVMVMGWDFEYVDERNGKIRKTVISHDLMKEATYPIQMHRIIDEALEEDEDELKSLFIHREKRTFTQEEDDFEFDFDIEEVEHGQRVQSIILSLKNGYGFIKYPPNNLYFHWTWLQDGDFNDLNEQDLVEFELSQNDKGQDVAMHVTKVASAE